MASRSAGALLAAFPIASCHTPQPPAPPPSDLSGDLIDYRDRVLEGGAVR